MIIDIRGTHGSGKSHVPHQLISRFGEEHLREDGKIIGTYVRPLELAIIGTYKNVCGGCDGVSPVAEIERRVKMLAESFPNVLLEGILVAHTFQRWADAARELGEYDYRFYFLDTPLETCINNVKRRRAERGRDPEFNTTNLKLDFRQIANVHKKLVADGLNAVSLPYESSVRIILEELNSVKA